jgi:hypothetical protein
MMILIFFHAGFAVGAGLAGAGANAALVLPCEDGRGPRVNPVESKRGISFTGGWLTRK